MEGWGQGVFGGNLESRGFMRVIISNKAFLGIISPRPAHTLCLMCATHTSRKAHFCTSEPSHTRTQRSLMPLCSFWALIRANYILISFLISGQLVFNSPRWEQVGLPQSKLYWVTASALRLCGRLTSLSEFIFWSGSGCGRRDVVGGEKSTERERRGQAWKRHNVVTLFNDINVCARQWVHIYWK